MATVQAHNRKRRWLLIVLAVECAILFGAGTIQDYYYTGHRPIFGQWHYWSFGLREGNLFGHCSDGEGDFFGEQDQFILTRHSLALGGVPYLRWNRYRFEASGPAWLPLAIVIASICFWQLRRRVKKKAAENSN